MTKLKVDIFKPSGKWYNEEYIDIRDNIEDFEIPDFIRNWNGRIQNMTYMFTGPKYEVKYLVYVGD